MVRVVVLIAAVRESGPDYKQREPQLVNVEKCVGVLDKPTHFYYFKNRVDIYSTPFSYRLISYFR